MNCNNSITSWVLENLAEGSQSEYIDIEDIKKKYEANITSRAIGNVIKKTFKNVTVKKVRSKGDWSKLTQIYCGLSWNMESATKSEIVFINIPSLLPPDFL